MPESQKSETKPLSENSFWDNFLKVIISLMLLIIYLPVCTAVIFFATFAEGGNYITTISLCVIALLALFFTIRKIFKSKGSLSKMTMIAVILGILIIYNIDYIIRLFELVNFLFVRFTNIFTR